MQVSETFIARFWAKVNVRGPDECWPWIGNTNKKGYGTIQASGRGSSKLYVHKVAVALSGTIVPTGKIVHHTCGMRTCVNRRHLEVTTYSYNNRGENHHLADKLWGGEPLELDLSVKENSGGDRGA